MLSDRWAQACERDAFFEEIARFLSYEWRCSRTHGVRPDRGCGVLNESIIDSFAEWAELVEPRLGHALTASFGSQLGKDAAVDALAHAWVKWDEVPAKDDRIGYVELRWVVLDQGELGPAHRARDPGRRGRRPIP